MDENHNASELAAKQRPIGNSNGAAIINQEEIDEIAIKKNATKSHVK